MKLIKTTTTTKINNQPRLLLVNTAWTDQHRRQAFSQFSEFSYFLTEKPWWREGQVFPWKNKERPGDEVVERAMMTSSWRHEEKKLPQCPAMLVFENGAFFALGKKTSKSQEPGVHRVSIIWCDCYLHNNFFSVFSPVFLFVLAFNPHQFSMLNTWNRVTDTWLTHNSSRRKYTDFVAWQKEWDRSAGHLVLFTTVVFLGKFEERWTNFKLF